MKTLVLLPVILTFLWAPDLFASSICIVAVSSYEVTQVCDGAVMKKDTFNPSDESSPLVLVTNDIKALLDADYKLLSVSQPGHTQYVLVKN